MRARLGFVALACLSPGTRSVDEYSMAISYSIDRGARLVRLNYEGEVTYEAWAHMMSTLAADRAFRPGFSVLADRRRAATATVAFVHCVVNFLVAYSEQVAIARWATVVDGQAAYGMSRMAQILLKDLPFPFAVFTDESSAIGWLFGRDDEVDSGDESIPS
jgi:hypothetical protein